METQQDDVEQFRKRRILHFILLSFQGVMDWDTAMALAFYIKSEFSEESEESDGVE